MKKTNSILRTLCLTAWLCLTAASASAYKVYRPSSGIDDLLWGYGDDKILVIESQDIIETRNFEINKGYAIVIKAGTKVYVRESFYNSGDLYIFGDFVIGPNGKFAINRSNIYIDKNKSSYTYFDDNIFQNDGQMYDHIVYSPRKVAGGSFPVTSTSGWNNYWEQGITCGDDFYPTGGFFEDANGTKPIADLKAWKAAHSNIDLGLKIGGTACTGWEYYDTDGKEGFFYNDLTLEGSQDFEANVDFEVSGTFTFERNMSAVIGKWQSWYEPFEVELTADVLGMMDVAQIAGVLTDGDGNTVVAFKKMGEQERMKANTPYVIRLKDPSGILRLTYEGATIRKPVENTYSFSSMYDDFEMGGIYKASSNSDWYALSSQGAFSKLNTATLKAQRLWLTIDPRTDSPYYDSPANTRAYIGMTVLGDDDTATGMDECLAPALPEAQGAIYDLSGQRVTDIRPGQIYIMNGRKLMAK